MSEEDATLIPVDFRAAPAAGIAVPYTELSAEALRGVVEGFVLREDQSGKFSRFCRAMKRGLDRSGSSSGSTLRKTKPFE